MEMDHRDSDLEGSMSNTELSDGEVGEEEEDCKDGLITRHMSANPINSDKASEAMACLTKLKQSRLFSLGLPQTLLSSLYTDPDMKVSGTTVPTVSAASPMVPPPPFSLPMAFSFPHPAAAFLPPGPSYPPPPQAAATHTTSSVSPLSSESSTSSQQQTWSFEEQFKQVRQLYEISDDPKRKEFLDDLFNFMQRRGTPINRLPIMAKSVLDLYELYNLVIQRGGLVDVINKKLWQEIIKGLHLPSSITSAAFTLRTQYMKYLYPYECDKRRLSTPGELQAAIDGNRREGRRGSYGTYAEMMQRSPTQYNQIAPLSLVTGGRPSMNGNSNHHHSAHHNNNNHLTPHQSILPPSLTGPGGLGSAEIEARMAEYVKLFNKELHNSSAVSAPNRQSSPPGSPVEPATVPTSGGMPPMEMSRLSLWGGIYGTSAGSPEPQKEALNLEKREDHISSQPPAKRPHMDNDEVSHKSGPHIKICSRGDGRGGSDDSLLVSMDINGTMYQGVLFAQATRNNTRLQS